MFGLFVEPEFFNVSDKFIAKSNFDRYLKIQASEKEVGNVLKVLKMVQQCLRANMESISIVAPSFSGKTQLAFALEKSLSSSFCQRNQMAKLLYWPPLE